MPVTIRSARLHDVPVILALEQQAPSAAHWTNEQYNQLVEGGVVLVAEEAGRLCGFVCAQAVAGEWEFENVVVAAEFLRRGIADELVRELIQRAKNEAASAILLEVRESNLPARGCTKNTVSARWAAAGCTTKIRRRTRFCTRFGLPRTPPGRSRAPQNADWEPRAVRRGSESLR